jgi:hypothetical protein
VKFVNWFFRFKLELHESAQGAHWLHCNVPGMIDRSCRLLSVLPCVVCCVTGRLGSDSYSGRGFKSLHCGSHVVDINVTSLMYISG